MTSELILYLEPSRSSSLWVQVQDFFAASCIKAWSGNEALRYPAHITMVGFFDNSAANPHSATNATSTRPTSTAKEHVIQYLDLKVAQMNADATTCAANSVSETTQVQGLIRPRPDSLLIAIEASPVLLDLIRSLQDALPELNLRLKRMNHLSLCYWDDEQEKTQKSNAQDQLKTRTLLTDQATMLAQEFIPMLCARELVEESGPVVEINQNGDVEMVSALVASQTHPMSIRNESWDIALYLIQNRDKGNRLPYPLVELKRWTLA